MVAISIVRKANGALASKPASLICVFVGATRGIGASTLRELVKHLKAPKIYILGRSKAKCTRQLAELGTLNPSASLVFLEAEVSRLRSVDEVCAHIKSLESSLDLFYMSPGVLAMGGPVISLHTDTDEGLDKCFALSYYGRMRFIHNLLPLLNQAVAPRVVSVLAGGQERRLITNDLGLKEHFSLLNVIDQTTTMHTLALEYVAETNPSISFLHVYPGWVQTDIMENFFNSKYRLSSTLYQILSVLARWLFLPIFSLVAMSAEEARERQLFHTTSLRYPSARTPQSQSSGQGEGHYEPAFECSVPGNGVYRVTAKGETVSDTKVLGPLREAHMPERIWNHTIEVFNEAVAL